MKLGHASADGRENLLAVLGPGEIVGELTLFDPGPRSTTATAVAPTELLTLDHNQLMTFVESHPQLAKDMLRALAQRLRRTNTALADLVFSDVPGRVAKALLDLADRFGSPTDDGVHVPPRPHSGGAPPSWWRLARDGQQVAGRVRLPRLDPPGGPGRHAARRRPPAPSRPLRSRLGSRALSTAHRRSRRALTPASTAETTPRLQPEGTGPQARHRARRPRRAARQDRGRLR